VTDRETHGKTDGHSAIAYTELKIRKLPAFLKQTLMTFYTDTPGKICKPFE